MKNFLIVCGIFASFVFLPSFTEAGVVKRVACRCAAVAKNKPVRSVLKKTGSVVRGVRSCGKCGC